MPRKQPFRIVKIIDPRGIEKPVSVSLYEDGFGRFTWRFRDKLQPDTLTPTALGRRLANWIGTMRVYK